MHHEDIELNFDASCQQILGLVSEILWEARSTPTLVVEKAPHFPLSQSHGTTYIHKMKASISIEELHILHVHIWSILG
jgi:hypothetical protein